VKAWYFAAGDEVTGPLSDQDMFNLIGKGVVTADTMVCYSDMGDEDPEWYPASESKISHAFSASAQTKRMLDLGVSSDGAATADSEVEFVEDSARSGFIESPEIIEVESSVYGDRYVYNGCFATGIILIMMFFIWGSDVRYRVHWFWYVLNFFAPAVSGVQLTAGGILGPVSLLLTIAHSVLVVWVLVLLFKDNEPWQRPVVIVDRIWGFCSFSALAVAIFVLICFLKIWADQNQRHAEEERAARILNKAWKMKN
jgi:hypothetical protein